MLTTTTLSEAAVLLLNSCATGPNPKVVDANRDAYRELARAGIMYPVSGFVHGPEANFRFTEEGWNRLPDLLREIEVPLGSSSPAPSPLG